MRLIAARGAHLDWMLGGPAPPTIDRAGRRRALALPPGGVDRPETLALLRAALARAGPLGPWVWLMVGDAGPPEIVGLCGTKGEPRAGTVEIGYGVAASRRGRGHASAAVALLLGELRARGLGLAAAETTPGNRASERVLERCGFRPAGRREAAHGPVALWWRTL